MALPAPATIKKAIVAGATGLIGSLTASLSDGDLTIPEVAIAVLTALVAGLGTYQVTNAPTDGVTE